MEISPGSLGKIGTLLGNAGIDIQAAGLSQDAEGDGATILLRVSQQIPEAVLTAIGEAVDATLIKQVDLS